MVENGFSNKNELERRIFSMYNEEIKRGRCKKCKAELDFRLSQRYNGKRFRCGPQSFWHLGKNFLKPDRKIRLAFVGKCSWYGSELEKNPKCGEVYDCRKDGPQMWNWERRYWQAVRTITEEEPLNLTIDDVFITNLAKCNISEKGNRTAQNITGWEYFAACVPIFEAEIQIVRPTHIVFFTGGCYDSLIRNMRFGFDISSLVDNRFDEEGCKKEIAMENEEQFRRVLWWRRSFSDNRGDNLHFLRTRHPQGAPKHFEKEVARWVLKSWQ
jgi:hypothetical protein